jgi:hypothetical protein
VSVAPEFSFMGENVPQAVFDAATLSAHFNDGFANLPLEGRTKLFSAPTAAHEPVEVRRIDAMGVNRPRHALW